MRPRPGTSAGAPSQLATLHLAGKTASLAGVSIGQIYRQQRSSSEGTVQVALLAKASQSAKLIAPRRQDAGAQAASSAAAPPPPTFVDKQTSALRPMERVPEPADSMTAASKAADADGGNDRDGEDEEGEAEPNEMQHPAAPLTQAAKPTDSFSSAAAGVVRTFDAPAPMAAPSLVSHHTGGGEQRREEQQEQQQEQQQDQRPQQQHAEDEERALGEETAPTPSARPALFSSVGPSAAAPALTHPGGSSILRPPPATLPRQLQGVVGAALARVAATAPRPGNSSNSDNHRVIVGVKRKASATGRPPMAPPLSQAGRTAAGLMQVVPSASSAGAANNGAEPTLTVEDAVSMVEQGIEVDAEVACDAVSKASVDGGGKSVVEVEVEGRRVLVVHPGLSRGASVGLSKANA